MTHQPSTAPQPAPGPTTSRHVVRATRAGSPDVLEHGTDTLPAPGPGEVLVEVAAVGVNFIDTYLRSGVYPTTYPSVLGSEGSGVVTAVGEGSAGIAVGDRIAWSDAPGSYASHVLVRADRALAVPDPVDLRTAAALPLQGLTAHYLATSTYPVSAGDDVLLHAGAGGVGLLLTQLAVARGARVVTTVSSDAKERLSRAAGAHEVIRYDLLDDLATTLPDRVRQLTGGHGVHVAYDGVGKHTVDASLASLRTRGMLVLFGASSGPVPPIDPQALSAAGSVYLVRPTLRHYVSTRDELDARARELFAAVTDGALSVRIGATFPLAEAARAHTALESRATTGKVLLVP